MLEESLIKGLFTKIWGGLRWLQARLWDLGRGLYKDLQRRLGRGDWGAYIVHPHFFPNPEPASCY